MNKTYRLTRQEMADFRRDQMTTVLDLIERFGLVAHVKVLTYDIHFVCDPDVIRELLVKQANKLQRDSFTRRIFLPIIGEGLLVAEGEAWRRQHKLVQPVFHATVIHEFVETFVAHAQFMVDGWQPGATLRLQDKFMGLALRIITRTMFGETIEPLIDRIGALMGAITEEAQAQLGQSVPLPAWLPTPGRRRQRRALAEVKGLMRDIVRKRQIQIERGNEPGSDLLALLLLARDEKGEPMSERQILDECMTLFFAGHETTAVAMTWTWFLLLTHPAVLEKLGDEVTRVVGDDTVGDDTVGDDTVGDDTVGNDTVSFDALGQMPYVEWVVKEALRLYPPVPGVSRKAKESFSINGHAFGRGDMLVCSSEVMHRLPEFFAEPDRFLPERWSPETPQPPRYAYLPFSAGPRTCIGNGFAMLEMQAVVATMVQKMAEQGVALSLVPGQEIEPIRQVTLRPSGGVKVNVEACA